MSSRGPVAGVAAGAVVLLIALALLGSLTWGSASPDVPEAVASSPGAAASRAPARVGDAGQEPWGVRRAAREDDRWTAAAAATFLERAVSVDDDDRERWVRSRTAAGRAPAVTAFVGRWVQALVEGRDVRRAPDEGSATGVRLRTLGGRVVGAGTDDRLSRVVLWQQVTVDTDPPTSAYVLTFTTLARTPEGVLVQGVDGIRAGPDPGPGTAMVYPPVQP